jgi:hypothetical protein
MAQLPAPGTQLSVSQINALKGVANANTSITTREQQYMGGNPARPSTSGVCMPEDVVIVTDGVNNTGSIARNLGGNLNGPVGPDWWTYSGPNVAGQAWTPTSFKEFASAYNNPPQVSVTLTTVTCPGVWNGSAVPCRDKANRTLTFSNGIGPYFYATAVTSSASKPAPSTFSNWSASTTNGPVGPNLLTGLPTPTAYVWAAVRDSLNCGTGFDLAFSAAYP